MEYITLSVVLDSQLPLRQYQPQTLPSIEPQDPQAAHKVRVLVLSVVDCWIQPVLLSTWELS
eukprot:7301535-Prorocentrum_lima.AAC.1